MNLREDDEHEEEKAGFRWYFTETNRRDAERFLEQPHNGKGTFLIRPSDTNQGKERERQREEFQQKKRNFFLFRAGIFICLGFE